MNQSNRPWRGELRALIVLAVPVVLSELGWMAQGVVDTVMVGRLGPSAIGAVALGNAVFYTPSLFGMVFCLDWTHWSHSPTAAKITTGAIVGWRRVFIWQSSSPPSPCCLFFWPATATPVSASLPQVAVPAVSYLRILNWGTLPLLIYGGSRRYLQGVGQVRVITVTFVGANLLNWFGNWVLIYGKWGAPRMGVDGSALSTVIARIVMAARAARVRMAL